MFEKGKFSRRRESEKVRVIEAWNHWKEGYNTSSHEKASLVLAISSSPV